MQKLLNDNKMSAFLAAKKARRFIGIDISIEDLEFSLKNLDVPKNVHVCKNGFVISLKKYLLLFWTGFGADHRALLDKVLKEGIYTIYCTCSGKKSGKKIVYYVC